jgi:hypothetical protein
VTAPDPQAAAVVVGLLFAVDERDWDAVRSSLAASVATDYTSLWGGAPESVEAEELIRRWRGLLPGFDATQHLIGPVLARQADQRRATCVTNVRAYHHLLADGGGATWMVAGRYVFALRREEDGWKVEAVTLHLAYEEGDRALAEAAGARVSDGAPTAR